MRRALLILVTMVLFWAVLAPVAYAVDWWPLVPCGLNKQPADATLKDGDGRPHNYTQPCNKCDLYLLFKNLIDFILFGVVPVGGTFFVIWAGFLILLGGANPGLQAQGMSILKNVFYGIVLIALSWLIVTSLLRTILGDNNQATQWWKISCTVTVPSGTPVPTGTPTPGAVPGQAQAQALINAVGLGAFSTDATCGGNFHARGNIQDIAGGRFPAVCSTTCSCAPNGTSVNPAILESLVALKNAGFSFIVTSFLTGKHFGGPAHYNGNAVDLVPTASSRAVWVQVRAFLDRQGGNAICEDKQSFQDVPDCNAARVTHIHWTR